MKKFSLLSLAFFLALVSFSFTGRPAKSVSRSLDFPVAGRHSRIEGFWGDNRDGGRRSHKGIDIYARKGTPVVAISDGVIENRDHTINGGKTLWLKPDNRSWAAYYAHLDRQLVREGQRVRKGQVIGTVGNTGNAVHRPPHLHFGISQGHHWVNPLPYVKYSPKIVAPHLAKAHRSASGKQKLHKAKHRR